MACEKAAFSYKLSLHVPWLDFILTFLSQHVEIVELYNISVKCEIGKDWGNCLRKGLY